MSARQQSARWSLVRPWATAASAPAASVAACAPHLAHDGGADGDPLHKRAREGGGPGTASAAPGREDAVQAKKQRSESGSGGSDHLAPMDAEPTAAEDEDGRKTPDLPGAALPGRSGPRPSPAAFALCSHGAAADPAAPDTTRLLGFSAGKGGHEHGETTERCLAGDGLHASGAPAATASAHVPPEAEEASEKVPAHDQGAGTGRPAEASLDTPNATQVRASVNPERGAVLTGATCSCGTAPGRQKDSFR
jgi:hypothetical protein